MFGYNPFYDDYYYYRPLRVYNPFSPMTRYMSRLEDRMNSLFSDIFEEEFNNLLEDICILCTWSVYQIFNIRQYDFPAV